MMMTHGQMPKVEGSPPVTPASEHLVMRSALDLDGREARRIFATLSDDGSDTMPMQPTFWVEAFGMATDRFGTPWVVDGGAPAPMPG